MYRKLPNNNRVSINRRVPFKCRVQVYILINTHRFKIKAGFNFYYYFFSIKEEDATTDTARFSSLPFSRVVLLPVSQYYTDDRVALVQQRNKKYNLIFKLSVIKYAEEISGEAAAGSFSVAQKRVRDW